MGADDLADLSTKVDAPFKNQKIMSKSNVEILKDLIKYSIMDEVKNVEDISYFEELIFKVGMLGEKRAEYTFENGLTLSVVAGENLGYYGDGKNTYEVAVLNQDKKFVTKEIEFSFDDVLGWQTPDQISNLITKIKNYEQK